MKYVWRLLALGALLGLFAAPASAQYVYLDTNGDGVWSPADVLQPNGTPTTVNAYINTNHNRDGTLAVCNTGDGDLGTWNSYAVNLRASGGTANFSNFVNQQSAFGLVCVAVGVDFTSDEDEMTACRATSTPTAAGLQHMFSVNVTGTAGTPSLQVIPLGNLSPNFTSFGTPCSATDFDNTYKLGTDFMDADGAGPAPGGNATPVLSAPTTAIAIEGDAVTITATATDLDAADVLTVTTTGAPSSLTLTTTPGTSSVTATLSGTLGLNDQGNYNIVWSVSDGTNPPQTTTTVLTVANLDQPPVVTASASVSAIVGSPLSVVVTVTEPDGDIITALTAEPLPGGATFTMNPGRTTGTLEWTPTAEQTGEFDVTFTATANGQSGSATTHISVSGGGADVPPSITAPALMAGSEGILLTFTVSATDANGDAITSLMGSPLPPGATFTANAGNTEGTFTWTPTASQSGTYAVTWTAANALSGTAVTAITIENVDHPPVLDAIADVTIDEGGLLTVNVHAADQDSELVILTATLPSFATLNAPTSGTADVSTTITLAPAAGSEGVYTATITAASGGQTDVKTFSITVRGDGADQAPIVTAPATISGTEGVEVTFTVTALDPEGEVIASLTASPLPAGATFNTNASYTSGTFTWTPSATQAGTYDVVFTASNALPGSATTHITIGEQGEDQAPVVTAAATVNGTEGVALSFVVTAFDADGDLITSLTAAPLPTGATFTTNSANTSGTFAWTPSATQAGAYDVVFTAVNALSGSATTHITIGEGGTGEDHPPVVCAPRCVTSRVGRTISFHVTASDADGDAITSFNASPLPAGATFTTNASMTSGTFRWSPVAGQEGTYDVTFMAANALSGSFVTHIKIREADQSVVLAEIENVTVVEGATVTVPVLATDADGDLITLTACLPGFATLNAPLTGTGTIATSVTISPQAGDEGTYNVYVRARGKAGDCEIERFCIFVNAAGGANVPPTITVDATATINEGALLTLSVTASDANGDQVDLTASGLPTGATFTDNGDNTATLSWTPAASQSGTHTVTFTANDGHGGTATATLVITVNDVAGAMDALVFTAGSHNVARLGQEFCVNVEPVEEAFAAGDVNLSSITLTYLGHTVTAVSSGTTVDVDANHNGVAEVEVCFTADQLAVLFGALGIGETTVNVTVAGTLAGGGTFSGSLDQRVVVGGNVAKGHGRMQVVAKPNPLNPKTDLSFRTSRAGRVRVDLFDSSGRLIRSLVANTLAAGPHTVPWDGTNERGTRVASGAYFFRIQAPDGQQVQRITVVK